MRVIHRFLFCWIRLSVRADLTARVYLVLRELRSTRCRVRPDAMTFILLVGFLGTASTVVMIAACGATMVSAIVLPVSSTDMIWLVGAPVIRESEGSLLVRLMLQTVLRVLRIIALVVVGKVVNLMQGLVHSSTCCTGAVGRSSWSLLGNIASVHPGNPDK